MNIYSVCHYDTYLTEQVSMFNKFSTTNCNFNIVIPNIHSKFCKEHFKKYNLNIFTAKNNWYIDIVNEIALSLPKNEYSIIIEWDIIPMKPIKENRFCSYRGAQSKQNKKPKFKSYYPNIIGFNPSNTTYNENFFRKDEKPFMQEFVELEHKIILNDTDIVLDKCAIDNDFSIVGDSWLHSLHGSNDNIKRLNCWRNIIKNL
jgi:hypothetical protein